MDILNLFAVFLIGVAASFIGASIGGGGLLSIPLLIFLGVPPQVTLAINKFAGIGLSIGAVFKYNQKNKIKWNYVLPLSIAAVIGGYLGSQILVNIDTELLSTIVGFLLLLPLPLLLLRKDIGVIERATGNVFKTIGLVLYFLGAIIGGFFGGGAGLIMFYMIVFFFGFTVIKANATHLFPWLLLSIVASTVFALNGLIDYQLAAILFLGMLLGGYLGARFAIKKGDRWVKAGFIVIIILSSLKLIFF